VLDEQATVAAAREPKRTALTPTRFVPVMMIVLPARPALS
jgi:hypothetical protein